MGVVGKSVETVKLRKLIVRLLFGDRWWSRGIAG